MTTLGFLATRCVMPKNAPVLLVFAFALLAPQYAQAKDYGRSKIRKVESWGYQLQGRNGKTLKVEELSRSDFDLLVVDFANGERPWTKSEVLALQRKPDGSRRLVLAYLSIGEAEDYRFYWKKKWKKHRPSFLAAANKEWKGNYKVRYWRSEWQRIIIGDADSDDSYLDQIVEAGFDGAYLDIVDAYEFFGPDGEVPERPKAAEDMCKLVARLANRARRHHKKTEFLIVPQNGSGILDELPKKMAKAYLSTIDAIGAEDTFYYGGEEHNNPLRPQRQTIENLVRFSEHGNLVLAVDYLTRSKEAANFVRLAREKKFIPYVGERELDRLIKQPAPQK